MENNCRFKGKHQANFSEEKEEDGSLFYAYQATREEKDDTWYINSGCSNHMTVNENIFCDIGTSVKSQVRMGNGALVEAKGKGTIIVETKKGTRYIQDVLLVPSLEQSLLSVGQMMENGYSLHFAGDSCTIYDKRNKSLEITVVKMKKNRNFPIQWRYAGGTAMKAQVDDSWLWHQRFGHFNFYGLKLLHQKNMMRDMPLIK